MFQNPTHCLGVQTICIQSVYTLHGLLTIRYAVATAIEVSSLRVEGGYLYGYSGASNCKTFAATSSHR